MNSKGETNTFVCDLKRLSHVLKVFHARYFEVLEITDLSHCSPCENKVAKKVYSPAKKP